MGNIIAPKCWIFLAYIYPWARNIHTIDSASEENTQIKLITSNLLAISVGICFLHVQETCSYTTLYACVFQHIVLPKLPNCATLKKSRLLFNWDDVYTRNRRQMQFVGDYCNFKLHGRVIEWSISRASMVNEVKNYNRHVGHAHL